jgi:hypothetical protein
MPVKITIRATREQLAKLTDTFKRAGDAAQSITDAAEKLPSESDMCKARRDLRLWSVASFQSILNRIFGR